MRAFDAQSPTRAAVLLGLGFGDCGKGLFADALCRRWPVGSVVRFNGGAQAGHNVVLPDGRHHTFSQFGAGTFVPGVRTLLASPVIVHPTALLVEAEFLARAGVTDALQRISIDARCRITTPYHQAAGRLRELLRGANAHGTCGVGVGETVRHSLAVPHEVLRYGDLLDRAHSLRLLKAARQTLLEELTSIALDSREPIGADATQEFGALRDSGLAAHWLDRIAPLLRAVPPSQLRALKAQAADSPTVLFEGAQGVLLDEWGGFHPHTTWSRVHPSAAQEVADELGIEERVAVLGVTRSYLTRHGAGPMPTAEAALDALAEPHNASEGWQGGFRRGHFDAVLMRYAIDVAGPLDGLLVSHLDAFDVGKPAIKWCDAYEIDATPTVTERVTKLALGPERDLEYQMRLCAMLQSARPVYDDAPIANAEDLIRRLEALSRSPVLFTSCGPTHEDVR